MPYFDAEIATMDHTIGRKTDYLDQFIPLDGASHADVVRYDVEITLRYAQCTATLACGRVVRLRDSRQFLGRSSDEFGWALLFVGEVNQIILRLDSDSSPSAWRPRRMAGFIGVDGEIVRAERWSVTEIHCTPAQQFHVPEMQPVLATGTQPY